MTRSRWNISVARSACLFAGPRRGHEVVAVETERAQRSVSHFLAERSKLAMLVADGELHATAPPPRVNGFAPPKSRWFVYRVLR
ncbi:unnamed protein product [Lampetra planeri]